MQASLRERDEPPLGPLHCQARTAGAPRGVLHAARTKPRAPPGVTWAMSIRIRRLLPALPLLFGLAGCGDDQDPEGAQDLWARIHDEGYQSWARAPGYATRQPTSAPHGDEVEIFLNPVIADALAAAEPLTVWPVGSLIVKDGYEGGELSAVAAMERREDQWFWAEWDADGESIYSGNPDTCTDCHQSGADMVRAFGFP